MNTLKKHYEIKAFDFDLAGAMSSDIKRTLKQLKFEFDFIKRVSVACYEAEINIVIHSHGGYGDFSIVDKAVYLQFIDCGPGIQDINLAMTPGYTTANEESRLNGFGAGMGLTNIKNSSDEMSLISDVNGTVLKLKFYITEDSYDAH
ncbi:MAG: anti-sigma regulatory factor [Tenericutes bacterium HGW-Tenericutes-1]|jgi:anti-sigma regulatory factor (Ser/Thr protein kinase)|nr:MAG: anti-sigma regulatory factor [Tenericutes bacterium HGW-Tenericutes-1]